mmetsp:Transcript_47575/g.132270  ORF Transcript_47575/g.132270 Transcript_47575/m.132270 type:complete len:405 (+) Transcript_47575:751-1965(+)
MLVADSWGGKSAGSGCAAAAGRAAVPSATPSAGAAAVPAAAAAAPTSHMPSKVWTWPQGHTTVQLPSPARKFGKPAAPEPGSKGTPADAAAASEACLNRASAAAAARAWESPVSSPSVTDPSTCPKPAPVGVCCSSPSTKPWNWAVALLSVALPPWLQKRWNRMYCAFSSPYSFQKLWSCGPHTLWVSSWTSVFMRSWYGRKPFRLSVRSRSTIISPEFWLYPRRSMLGVPRLAILSWASVGLISVRIPTLNWRAFMMSMIPGSVASFWRRRSASYGGGSEYLNSALMDENLYSASCFVPQADCAAARARFRRLRSSRSSSAKPFTRGSGREDCTKDTSCAELATSISLEPAFKPASPTEMLSASGRSILPRLISLQFSRGKSRASCAKSKMEATGSSAWTGTS